MILPGSYTVTNTLVAGLAGTVIYIKQDSVIIILNLRKADNMLTTHVMEALFRGKFVTIQGSLSTFQLALRKL